MSITDFHLNLYYLCFNHIQSVAFRRTLKKLDFNILLKNCLFFIKIKKYLIYHISSRLLLINIMGYLSSAFLELCTLSVIRYF